MTVRRLPVAAAVLALLGATACEKPAPQITVSSSGRVVNVDASRYCFGKCRDFRSGDKSIRVRGNTVVGIDLPKRVADKGWILLINDQPQFRAPNTESHYSLNIPTIPENPNPAQSQSNVQRVPVSIVEAESGNVAAPTGAWKMQFVVRP